jgi:hypothetical protein
MGHRYENDDETPQIIAAKKNKINHLMAMGCVSK